LQHGSCEAQRSTPRNTTDGAVLRRLRTGGRGVGGNAHLAGAFPQLINAEVCSAGLLIPDEVYFSVAYGYGFRAADFR